MIEILKKTKIVATLGPSITGEVLKLSDLNDKNKQLAVIKAYQTMEALINNGADVLRLNFSHGSYEENLVRIKIARDVAEKNHHPISIMLDTKGPEIRVGKLKNRELTINIGDIITIYTKKNIVGTNNSFSVSDYSKKYNMAKDLKNGDIILVDDGKLSLLVQSINALKGIVKTIAKNSHLLLENKRINLPNVEYSIPFLSSKDINDIKFAIENKIEYISASFVNSKKDVQEIKKILLENKANNIQIISKIESAQSIKNINEIIEISDGIMIARGDLGLEISYDDIPYWEKYIIKQCRFAAKPVIVATQMLDSLERNLTPTRAEITDVYYAVEKGADATMLSGETAKGLFPINAINTMTNINKKSEIFFDYKRAIDYYFKKTKFNKKIKKNAIRIARKCLPLNNNNNPYFKYDFLIIFSNEKELLLAISNIRIGAKIILFSDQKSLINSLGINYGIYPFFVENLELAKKNYQQLISLLKNDIKIDSSLVFFDDKFWN